MAAERRSLYLLHAVKCLKPSDGWIGKRLPREGETGDGTKESELCRRYLVMTRDRIGFDLM